VVSKHRLHKGENGMNFLGWPFDQANGNKQPNREITMADDDLAANLADNLDGLGARMSEVDCIYISWYRGKEDYGRVYALAPDGGGMEPTFEEFKRVVKKLMPALKARGLPIKKVIIDPDNFANWLRATNNMSTPTTRARYGWEVAQRRHGTH
jgi:hypothetical protein